MTAVPSFITSRDNPLLKEVRKLARASTDYRRQGRIWLEGDHLLRAAVQRGQRPEWVIYSEDYWPIAPVDIAQAAIKNIVIPAPLFAGLSGLESPAQVGALLRLAPPGAIDAHAPTVVLDRLQDAGNVGAVLRSASAFGFVQVLALAGTAALWSPKVLRAGMGAHWGLHLHEGLAVADLAQLQVPMLCTSSHGGVYLHQAQAQGALPWPCAWALGHEGQGVQVAVQDLARIQVRIAQPGGEESLNVAAAAAICLHASATAHLA
jgi:TrmH family RNA methyltransferase